MPAHGEELTVARAEALIQALAPGLPTGQPPHYALPSGAALALRGCVLARSTENASHFALAVEDFATLPICPPEVRAKIQHELELASRLRRLPRWPSSLRRAGLPTITEAAWFRGPKHVTNVEMVDRRLMQVILTDGTVVQMGPHSIREYDDASQNAPSQCQNPDTGELMLTRQALWSQDVYSAALMSVMMVARPRDAYRIEDVADFIDQDFTANGVPKFIRLEMGRIWNGQFIHGFVPVLPNTRQVIPGWPDGEKWGGLQPLCGVLNVHKSKGKGGLESSFNLTQAMNAHASLDIGRHRGEFEHATKALIRRVTEIDESFWDIDASSDATRAVAQRFNARQKIRHAFGRHTVCPDDLLRGAKGLPLVPGDRWRLTPVKRVAVVRGGHVQITVEHYEMPFRFRVNGETEGLHLDNGWLVLLAFHPGRPERGCWVFNAELGTRNRDARFGRAELLLCAPHAPGVPQVDLTGHPDFAPRKKANAAARRNYRAIAAAVASNYAQDSNGKHLKVGIDADGARTVESHPPLGGEASGGDGAPAPSAEARAERRAPPNRTTATTPQQRRSFREQAALAAQLITRD